MSRVLALWCVAAGVVAAVGVLVLLEAIASAVIALFLPGL